MWWPRRPWNWRPPKKQTQEEGLGFTTTSGSLYGSRPCDGRARSQGTSQLSRAGPRGGSGPSGGGDLQSVLGRGEPSLRSSSVYGALAWGLLRYNLCKINRPISTYRSVGFDKCLRTVATTTITLYQQVLTRVSEHRRTNTWETSRSAARYRPNQGFQRLAETRAVFFPLFYNQVRLI